VLMRTCANPAGAGAVILLISTLLPASSAVVFAAQDTRTKVEQLHRKVNSAYLEGRYHDAIEAGEEILRLDSKSGRTMYTMARLHCKVGERERALDYLEQAAQIDLREIQQMSGDEDLEPLRGMERFERLLRGQVPPPRRPAVEVSPPMPPAPAPPQPNATSPPQTGRPAPPTSDAELERLTTELIAAAERMDFDRALELAEEARRRAPDSPMTNYNLACVHARMNHREDALYYLEQSARVGMTDAAHMEADPNLANLRGEPRYRELVASLRAGQRPPGSPPLPPGAFTPPPVALVPESGAAPRPAPMAPRIPAAPVFVLLESGGGRADSRASAWAEACDLQRVVLVTPDGSVQRGPDGYGGGAAPQAVDQQVFAAIDRVRRERGTLPGGVFIIGHAEAAADAMRIALQNPRDFGGVIAIEPYLGRPAQDVIRGADLYGLRVYIAVEDDDRVERLEKTLKKCGAKTKVREIENLFEMSSKRRLKEQERAIEWVLEGLRDKRTRREIRHDRPDDWDDRP